MKPADPGLIRAHTSLFWLKVIHPLLIASGYSVDKWGVLVKRIEVNGSRCWEYSVRPSDVPANRPRVDELVFRSMQLASVGAKDFIDDAVSQALEYLHATEPGAQS